GTLLASKTVASLESRREEPRGPKRTERRESEHWTPASRRCDTRTKVPTGFDLTRRGGKEGSSCRRNCYLLDSAASGPGQGAATPSERVGAVLHAFHCA